MRIGVSNASPQDARDADWRGAFDVSEWDVAPWIHDGRAARERRGIAALLRRSDHKPVVSAGAYLLPARELAPGILEERIEAAAAIAAELGASALLIRVPLARRDADRALFRRYRELVPASLELWFDPGRVFFRHALPGTRWVADPLWHPGREAGRDGVYKIHGWHEARWVRRYGDERLAALARRCLKEKPAWVLFAHSMRNEEARRFAERISCSSRRP